MRSVLPLAVGGRGGQSLLRLWISVAILSLLLATRVAWATELPRVRLIATGGTIATREAGVARLGAQELVAAVPKLAEIAEISFEQFSNLSSDRITPEHWLGLAQRVNVLLAGDTDAVVITHGTDTLEETAYFLNLTVRSTKPVVLVGSMRRASAISADGPANLLSATRVAASASARGRGVLVVLNDEIHAARDVTKTSTLRLDTFRSRGFGPLGTIDDGQVRFYRRTERTHTVDTPFDVSRLTVKDLPRVDIVYVYAGADAAAIESNVERGAKGLVTAGMGAGGLTEAQMTALKRVLEQGIVVVIASRTGSGIVPGVPASMIGADDLLPQKARVLLMLALSRTSDPREVQRMFDTF